MLIADSNAGSHPRFVRGYHNVRTGADNGVVVIFHDGISADLDSKDPGKVTQSINDPQLAVGVIPAGDCIVTTEKGAADTPAEALKNTNLSFFDVMTAWESHGSPRFITSNCELMD
jgi:hypothetical protein